MVLVHSNYFSSKRLDRIFYFLDSPREQSREEEGSRGQDPLAKAMQRRRRSPQGAPPAQGLSPSMEALGSPFGTLSCPPGPVPAPSRVLLAPCTPRPGCSRRPMAFQPAGSPGSEAASFSAAIAVCLHLPCERERSNKVLVRGALNPQNGFYLSPPAAAISHPPLLPPQGNQSKRG